MPVQFDATYPTLTIWLQFPAPIGSVDVTDYLHRGGTFNGRQRGADRFDARGMLLLENWDGRFSRSNLSGPYVSAGVSFIRPRVGIYITAQWGATTYDVFTGEVKGWQEDWKGNAAIEGFDALTAVTFVGKYASIARWSGRAVAPVGEGEMSGARIARILTAQGWTGGTALATGDVPMQATDLAGNGMQQILDVVDAECGSFYIEPSGIATFEARSSLVVNSRSNTSQVTFSDASVYFRDVRFPESNDDTIVNDVAMQREGGAVQTASDPTSQTLYGVRTYNRSGLPALEDVFMQSAAEFNVARWKDPEDRIDAVTIDPAQAPSVMWPHALGRRIHDRATITAYNARQARSATYDSFIEGFAHSFSQFNWETTFYFSDALPWNGFSASVFDTGVFDTAKFFY